ncbi:FapA family protein [Desulfurispirillum indicum]|uniref:Flagellar Assembly Protein A N-terminal region domain-containing protein n=1 Tax=Desulfurispirillum indicum (strain ATCC BAA-1389 / DSM 22839 / S5) TaxID=653733 RepID=E6W291_DESIS|nr:FapA family protein [Desulfurispirillum indicum]ADU65549.1 protein of unknown function DUF342 [Desulfurispirillum indicum S5]UCZ57618.1 FapA family protein [Desulfurispirillum indicum]
MSSKIPVTRTVSLEISDDKLKATLLIYSLRNLSDTVWRDAVDVAHIAEPYVIDVTQQIRQIQREHAKSAMGFPLRITIATGVPPVHGEDSSVHYSIDLERSPGEIDEQTGAINFRERGLVKEVKSGNTILEIQWATKGVKGFTIFGKTIAARNGENRLKLKAGAGVREQHYPDNERTLFIAQRDGVVLQQEQTIIVSEVFALKGDVDYATGNIRFDGSVTITGTVKAGFEIEATGDVTIEGHVEKNAVIKGESVVINGGCYGNIKARRLAQMDFAENARVTSEREVVIKSIARTEVIGTNVMVNSVISSRITAYDELVISEINSSLNMPSFIIAYDPCALEVINQFRSQYSNLSFEMELLESYFANIGIKSESLLGEARRSHNVHLVPPGYAIKLDEGGNILSTDPHAWFIPPDASQKAKRLAQVRELLVRFKEVIKTMIQRTPGTIRILSHCDRDTVIDMYGVEKYLNSTRSRCTFTYDFENNCIIEKLGR